MYVNLNFERILIQNNEPFMADIREGIKYEAKFANYFIKIY